MITDYVKAGYPVLQVRTYEPERFIASALKTIQETTWRDQEGNPVEKKCFRWDLVRGLRELGNGAPWQEVDQYDLPNVAAGYEQAVFFLSNFHFSIQEPGIIQALQNNLGSYKSRGVALVMVSPDGEIPMELERDVVVLDFPLPTRDELKTILDDLVAGTGIQPDDEDAVLDAAQGLTWSEAEDALSLALVRQKRFDPKTITELKAQMVKKAAALEYLELHRNFSIPGRPGQPQELDAGPFPVAAPRPAFPGHPAPGGSRDRQEPFCQGPGESGGLALPFPGPGEGVRFPGRTE